MWLFSVVYFPVPSTLYVYYNVHGLCNSTRVRVVEIRGVCHLAALSTHQLIIQPFFLLFFLSLALSLVLSTNSFYLALFAFSFSFVLYAHTYLVFIASFVVCCLLCVCVLLLFDPSVFVWLLCLFVELVLINFAFTHLLLRRRITMIWCFLFSFNCPLFSTILNSHLAFNQNTILLYEVVFKPFNYFKLTSKPISIMFVWLCSFHIKFCPPIQDSKPTENTLVFDRQQQQRQSNQSSSLEYFRYLSFGYSQISMDAEWFT